MDTVARRRWTLNVPSALVGASGAIFLAGYALGLLLRPGERYLQVQSDIIYNLLPFGALCLAIVPIRRTRGRQRLGWLCLAFLLATWLVGDSVFSYYDLVQGEAPPFPGWADAAYYPGYLGFIAALALLTLPEQRLRDRRWLLDAGIVVVVAGTVMWEYLMEPIVDDGTTDMWGAAVGLGYPLLDLALFAILAVTIFASRGSPSALALTLAAAAAFQVVADGVYSYVVTTTGYDPVGNPIELLWLASYALLAVGCVLPVAEPRETAAFRPSLFGLILPYAFGSALLALTIVSSLAGRPEVELIAGASVAIMLVVSRQFLTLRDNLALLIRAANYDELTGLPNRRTFTEQLKGRRIPARSGQAGGAVVVLGVDDLKSVNDGLGREVGDGVILRVAETLRARFSDQASRLDGDVFAVYLPAADAENARIETEALLDELRRRPVVGETRLLHVTASAGIALPGERGATSDELLAGASQALDRAKALGGNQVHFVDTGSRVRALSEARLVWKERINQALEFDRFVLYCQPIIDLRTGRLFEDEVLLRMIDEQGRLQPPTDFLQVAERFGLIQEIDRWVLSHAIELLGLSRRRGRDRKLSVNLSGRAFEDADLVPFIKSQLRRAEVSPGQLTLEVTETAAVADLERAGDFIQTLKALGCSFALDDFGVGFSSFAHLKYLPVDYLKIDGAFIRDLPRTAADQHIVRAMAEVARGLGKQTIAEFVQDEATVDILRQLGVEYGQGFYLGKPAPASEPAGEETDRRRAA